MFKVRSLRFWIGLCMMLALVPLATSAVGGYFLLNHGVNAAFRDVAFRQGAQIIPAQQLHLLMMNTLAPVDEYVDGGDMNQRLAYRVLRGRIETGFDRLGKALRSEPAAKELLDRAREDWTAADHNATELISVSLKAGDPHARESMQRFHGEVAAATDKLGAVYEHLAGDIKQDHATALLFYERSIWLAGIAAVISLLTAIGGVVLIGRVMAASVDRLVDGAARFASGDREHRIEVHVPPELRRVAEEFNHMIGRIHDSEEMLGDLAHRDSLTRLFNRRAFDEALNEMFSRARRFGEQIALLALDIDHFKRVNDAYGHAAGDEVLRATAAALTATLRPYDRAFRVGGEEFAVLLPGTDLKTAQEIAERMRKAIEIQSVRYKDFKLQTTLSVGIATAGGSAGESELVEAADAALYQAKQKGRNRVVVDGKGDGRRDNRAA